MTSHRARKAVPRSMPVLRRRSTVDEWIWSTTALTAKFLARSSYSSSSTVASLAASSANVRVSSGAPDVSKYTPRDSVARAKPRIALDSRSGTELRGYTTASAARASARTSRTVRSIWSAAAA